MRVNPNDHPIGTRFIGKNSENEKILFEARVVEWSPSKNWVKLKFTTSEYSSWSEPLMVVEVLPHQQPIGFLISEKM